MCILGIEKKDVELYYQDVPTITFLLLVVTKYYIYRINNCPHN